MATSTSDRFQLLSEGLVAGVLGYATVVLGMALVNVLDGHSPFYTAALLGNALFYHADAPSTAEVWAGPVIAYNGIHLLAYLILGLFMAWLARLAERGPHLWYLGTLAFMFVAFHLLGLSFLLPPAIRGVVMGWVLCLVGLTSSIVMAAYLVWIHPRIRMEWLDFSAQDPDLADVRR